MVYAIVAVLLVGSCLNKGHGVVRLNEKDRRSFQRSFREKMNLFNTSRDRAESEVISVSRGGGMESLRIFCWTCRFFFIDFFYG